MHRTQFLLAAVDDHAALGERLAELGDPGGASTHRFDPPRTAALKRLLQHGLPEHRRRVLLDRLFAEHVTDDEQRFADALYLTLAQCRELICRNHAVIGHGFAHRRLGLLDEAAQRRELEQTRAFVSRLGGTWAFSYPYGSRDETTLRLLRASGCRAGLTTDPGRAGADADPLQLPRIDTNDLQLEVVERARADGPVA